MTPLLLSMQAFGPYAAMQVIDFTEFGPAPMFLINGPTGAGKSTILDAICYALYGLTSSGSERRPQDMRNVMSTEGTSTEVEFTFGLAGKRWRILRKPVQQRQKARGKGITQQAAMASLTRIDSDGNEHIEIPRKVTDVDQRIKELTGLNHDQFRQVMVLPQGQFRALLLAKSSEREEILSTLFGTHVYRLMEKYLSQEARQLDRAAKQHKATTDALIESAGFDSQSELKDAIVVLKTEKVVSIKATSVAEAAYVNALKAFESAKAIDFKFSALNLKQIELQGLSAKTSEYDLIRNKLTLHKKASILLPVKQRWRDAVIKLVTLEEERDRQLQRQVVAVQKHEEQKKYCAGFEIKLKQADDLEKEKDNLMRFSATLDELEPLRNDIKRQAEELQKSESEIEKLDADLLTEKTKKIKLASSISELQGSLEKLPNVQDLLHETSQALEKQLTLERQEGELGSAKEKMDGAAVGFANKIKLSNVLDKEHKLLAIRWHSSQASLLSESLEDHVPCPVCGSTEHPDPAKGTKENIDKDTVDRSQVLLDKANQERESAAVLAEQCKTKYTSFLQTVEKATAGRIENARHTHGKTALVLQQECQLLQKQKDDLAATMSVLEAHRKESITLESLSEAQTARRIELDRVREGIRLTLGKKQSEVDSKAEQIPSVFRQPDACKERLIEIEKIITQIQSSYAKAQAALLLAKENELLLIGQIKAIATQVSSSELEVKRLLSDWQSARKEAGYESDEVFNLAILSEVEASEYAERTATFDKTIVECTAVITQLENELKLVGRPNLDECNELLVNAGNERKRVGEELSNLTARQKELDDINNKLEKLSRSFQETQKAYDVIGRLSEVASGKPPDTINFQRFVLGVLLDDVLTLASVRMSEMTGQRYSLVRAGESQAGRPSGLDLNVTDAYTGAQRPVSTLSGGESFQAALSLALGLSEVVQSYSGGIQLDTLFIDEGFGSLDPESLERAVQTLVELQASGRMIGVISHMEQLKEQLPKRIDIKPSITGNTISMVL